MAKMNDERKKITMTPAERKRRPVFVMGCHRSGTNLLYDNLLSAGGFAIYRGYLPVYEILISHFGSLDNVHQRENTVSTWLKTKSFERSGLDAGAISAKLLSECRNGGDFIRIVMDEIATAGGAQRWALYDPDSVLHVARIKREIPDALFVHIIRDGRDIALSLMKMGGFRPFPWNRKQRSLIETALYWDWMVHNGRRSGRVFAEDYIEIHYEELVAQPRKVLAKLGGFIDHDLITIAYKQPALEDCANRIHLSGAMKKKRRIPLPAGKRNSRRWRSRRWKPSSAPACKSSAMS